MSSYRLYDCPGSGSVIVRALFAVANVPFEAEIVDIWDGEAGRDRLRAINPLVELPTLLMPDGRVMSESVAIALHLADIAPQAGLLPPPGHPDRAWCLRWLVFLSASVYATFTFGDHPDRYVSDISAQAELREGTGKRRQELWQVMDAAADVQGPWFLSGAEPTAIDVFIAVMTQWRPRRPWFAEHAPRLHRIAVAAESHPGFGRNLRMT
jgi:GST-like protein